MIMDTNLNYKILFLKSKNNIPLKLKVKGCSMYPIIKEDDEVVVKRYDFYEPGDILVFTYNTNELLIHRLLRKKEDFFLCKGDNSFRLEIFTKERIIGKVVEINNGPVPFVSQEQIYMSFEVNKEFTKNNYDVDKTVSSEIYKIYFDKYIKKRNIGEVI